MSSKKEIVFTEDILREVAKENGWSYDKVNHVYKTTISYIHYLANKTPCLSIFIPKLGTLYLKYYNLKKELERLKTSKRLKEKYKVFLSKKRAFDEYAKEALKHLLVRDIVHFGNHLINKCYYTDCKKIREIEEFQNNRYN